MEDTTHSGGSAPPDAPGPGTGGVTPVATQLTGVLQSSANDTLDGIQELSNHIFDAGEGGLTSALQVVDALQTGVSAALTGLTRKIVGVDVGEIPTIPTAEVASGLSGAAQDGANKALNGLQQFSNHVYDVGETGVEDALRVVDAAQTRVSGLFSTLTGLLAAQVGKRG